MRRFVRAHPILCYYLLALAICSSVVAAQMIYSQAWLQRTGHRFEYNEGMWTLLTQFGHGRMYANLISLIWCAFHMPIYFGVFIFGGAPTISAVIINAIGWGWAGVAKLFGRLKPWASKDFRTDALIVYAGIFVLMFGMTLMHVVLLYIYKGPAAAASGASIWGLSPWLLPLPFIIGGFIDEGATPEELGWRGFALPIMLDKIKTPLVAALFLGFLWWLWHFPREIPDILAGKTVWPAFITGQLVFMGLVIAMTVVMTFCFHRTGSALPAILIHGWGNFAAKAVGIYEIIKTDDRTWMFFIVAILLIIFTGLKLGRAGYLEKRGKMGIVSEIPAIAAEPA